MLEETRVRLSTFSPVITNPITRPVEAVIDNAKIEFNDSSLYDLQGDPYRAVATQFDITGSQINYRIIESGGRFSNVDDDTGFNGTALTFLALQGNPSARIRSVDILADRNTLAVPQENISFTRDTVYMNVDNLSFSRHEEVTLQLGFRLDGTKGQDVLTGDMGNDVILGRAGSDILFGGAGKDRLEGGSGNDQLEGGAGRDLLNGGAGNDRLSAGAGNDRLIGGAGNDRLLGGAGNDRLNGGTGRDTLDGGTGADILTGGAGADVFLFRSFQDSRPGSARDVITDFAAADRIDLSALDANSLRGGNQRLEFSGTDAQAHSLWYVEQANRVILRADHDGDARADFEVALSGISSLSASDFIL